MATKNDFQILPSLLDRLLDDHPELSVEPVVGRSQDFRRYERAVARDLEALLNSRQEILEELAADFAEVGRSLITYGLPDLTSLSLLNQDDRHRIRRAVEDCISSFEPRLQRVRVTLETPKERDRGLHFRIDALLRVDPTPEPVTFDAVLDLSTQQYVIQRES
jgi:type VI secretion system protein ImpF